MKKIPEWKLKKTWQSTVTLHKVSSSTLDDEFGVTTDTETNYTISAEIQPITLEDMAYLPAGMVSEGDAWGYFAAYYTLEGQQIEVDVNDYITFKSIKYLVQRIVDYYEGNDTVYRKALLKRQVGK